MKVLYLDESGNHDLNPKKINQNYPIFALGGVIVERSHVRDVIEPEMRQFKLTHFGREDICLHTVDMGRGRGDYGFLADPTKRKSFYDDLNAMLDRWDYQVMVCVFEKIRYLKQYSNPVDPYHYGIEILIERFCVELGSSSDAGMIYAEMRNPNLDRELLLAWERFRQRGTDYARPDTIDRKIIELLLKDKKANMAGLQLADLVVTPVGRHVAGKPPTENEVLWSVVEKKLRRVGGTYKGRGLIIRP